MALLQSQFLCDTKLLSVDSSECVEYVTRVYIILVCVQRGAGLLLARGLQRLAQHLVLRGNFSHREVDTNCTHSQLVSTAVPPQTATG